MSRLHHRITRRLFRVSRLCVRLIWVAVILLVASFVYLRMVGVPKPILRSAIRRVNDAGVPVDVENIMLTLRGWRADNVRYYSKHPDDVDPLIIANHVYFARIGEPGDEESNGWSFEVEATGVKLHPSVEWGLQVPAESAVRNMDKLRVTVGFLPDRITLTNGRAGWLGLDFSIDGTVMKRPKDARPPPDDEEHRSTILPQFVDAEQFQALEDRLQALKVHGNASVDIDLYVDTRDYAESHANFSAKAADIEWDEVHFSGASVTGYYTYPKLELYGVGLKRDNQTLSLSGTYDFSSKQVSGGLINTIESKRMLQLLPDQLTEPLSKLQLQLGSVPRVDIKLGPAAIKDIPNALSGSFTVKDVTFRGLEIESLIGKVTRKNRLLELSELRGIVVGQEARTGETGSCMVGGIAQGTAFWDAEKNTFGVTASGSMDPNLLVGPLDMVPVATNVIQRFRFKEQPPKISLELGSNLSDWSTFFINIQGMGHEVFFHDTELSSLNTVARYQGGVLRLDPLAAMRGVDFMKGSASIDFKKSTVWFDAFGSLRPAVVEDLVYPEFNIFGNKIITRGNTQIKARGTVDWKDMDSTRFEADVEADRVTIPVGHLDSFQATVVGKGPEISVVDAAFNLYGGKGDADFTIRIDPETKGLPYSVHLDGETVDFKEMVQFHRPGVELNISGKMSGSIDFEADMLSSFFKTANGTGTVSVTKGQLADLPLFSGFSKLIRKVVPSFKVFSITSFQSSFAMNDGVLQTEDAFFGGDVISASASGSYAHPEGYDALVKAAILRNKGIGKVLHIITSPIMKIFEMELTGTYEDPSWRLKRLPGGSRSDKNSPDSEEED